MPISEEETLLELCPKDLSHITQKIVEKQRLTIDDGLFLFATPHLSFLQQLADFARHRNVGDTVFYASTLHIYPTNLCELSCPMCSFYAKPGQDKAWFLTPVMIEEKIQAALPFGISEVHIVSGLWRQCSLEYYKEVFHRIRTLDPSLHIKALTPVEYDFLARTHGITICEVLQKMISWGLSSLPGGGAEILDDGIREKIAPGKISSQKYLDIHRTAHMLGLPSNITMLFGHIEDDKHIIEHLDKVRRLQDQTKGFHTFVPLKYHCENNALGKVASRLKEKDCRRIYALSRLMLDNVQNIKVLWNYMGLQLASEMLSWGGNDLGSVTCGEQVALMAGGVKMTMTDALLEDIIRSKGRIPMKVHSGHVSSLELR
jgi:CofH subfamily radical SAM domain protein